MVLIPPLMRYAGKTGLLDIPGERKVHNVAIPRVGGIALVTGSICSILLSVTLTRDIEAILMGIGVLLIFGVWDDRVNLNYKPKFTAQIAAALIVILYGGIQIGRLPFLEEQVLSNHVMIALTVLFLVAITNAINMADGLDGLSAGKSLLIFGCLALLAYQADHIELAILNIIFAGAILGFLRFNTHPAGVFMGDSGSQTIGFTAATLSVVLTQQSDATLSPMLPLILFALPVFDTMSVITQRLYVKRSPFAADNSHLHHKLLKFGLNHNEAVLFVYIVQAFIVTVAYFLRYESDAMLLALFLLFCGIMGILLYLCEISNFRLNKSPSIPSLLRRALSVFSKNEWLLKISAAVCNIFISIFFVLGALAPYSISSDFGVMALAVLMLVALFWLSMPRISLLCRRAIVYIASAFSIYLLEAVPGHFKTLMPIIDACFVVLAIAVIIGVRSSSVNRLFKVTTLDFLVIFLCIIVPGLSLFTSIDIPIADLSAKLVVSMYACELILTTKAQRPVGILLGATTALSLLSMRWLV